MRPILHIALAATLAAICVLPVSGQDYRRNKVRVEPEPLTFTRIITVSKELNPNLFELTRGWDLAKGSVDRGVYFNAFDDNYIHYWGNFNNLNAKKENYDLLIRMKLFYLGPYNLELLAYDITSFGDKHPVMHLSAKDDRFNRPWLWRVLHDIETVDMERKAAEECFNMVADSLEEFLKDGPPLELKPL